MDVRDAFQRAVQTGQVDVSQDARAGASEGNPDFRPVESRFILILEANPFREELKKIVGSIDVRRELAQQNIVIHRREVVRDIPLDYIEWRASISQNRSNSRLAAIEPVRAISISVGRG